MLEAKISTRAKEAHKQAIGQAGFCKEHCTMDHMVTLRVLMDESKLHGHTLVCSFFKKSFDMVPKGGLWARMQILVVPPDVWVGISQIYEKVPCRLKQNCGLSSMFQSNMGNQVAHSLPLCLGYALTGSRR